MWLSPALLLLSFPGYLSIQGPASVRGPEQGSVTVQCRYGPRWKNYNKWWCRGTTWNTCRILIQTTSLEKEKTIGRLSIRDNQRDNFQVTMEMLEQNDTGTYWCGIQKTGIDRGVRVTVTVDPVGESTMPLSKLPARPAMNNSISMEFSGSSGAYKRTHYVLLVFVKVPALIILAGAVLWMKRSQRGCGEQWGQSLCRTSDSELLTKDMAP
ncbi:CMRF35-like molecule 7 [Nannospalax galili]|uniref:CMRF35-like molecule 7 n=1 Tax=Nannospalax galili TaxID=1026970 RepID=UPI00111BCF76|nr:CMRF35-like molecule 7 [Nannospalax galili]